MLRDVYVCDKYRDVILPMTVLRRLDAVLEPTKQAVLEMKAALDSIGVVDRKTAFRRACREAFFPSVIPRDAVKLMPNQVLFPCSRPDRVWHLSALGLCLQDRRDGDRGRGRAEAGCEGLGQAGVHPPPQHRYLRDLRAGSLAQGEGEAEDKVVGGREHLTLVNEASPFRSWESMPLQLSAERSCP